MVASARTLRQNIGVGSQDDIGGEDEFEVGSCIVHSRKKACLI
ncbi:MAG: hypothetical protein OJF50_006119 [Nitrospira sp.]|nr:hypothetical protein [Nitrospira sp.]